MDELTSPRLQHYSVRLLCNDGLQANDDLTRVYIPGVVLRRTEKDVLNTLFVCIPEKHVAYDSQARYNATLRMNTQPKSLTTAATASHCVGTFGPGYVSMSRFAYKASRRKTQCPLLGPSKSAFSYTHLANKLLFFSSQRCARTNLTRHPSQHDSEPHIYGGINSCNVDLNVLTMEISI